MFLVKQGYNMKFKRKGRNVTKYFDGEKYLFKNGVAVIPGMWMNGNEVKISIKMFNELTKKY